MVRITRDVPCRIQSRYSKRLAMSRRHLDNRPTHAFPAARLHVQRDLRQQLVKRFQMRAVQVAAIDVPLVIGQADGVWCMPLTPPRRVVLAIGYRLLKSVLVRLLL